ncbi:MmgE/PrpD family protein [Cryobacterium levicorallinum]|uniref:2-methylcitrate dehydratase PrpD n=1 Tax=Cryobacterium levicorallinum TaxID=995038 RepID=A0ABY1EI45_9MICO|nr:MmgE/PrpD family protein [Cryobacterium levicorallinum]GEP28574.1 2-methylcitrate dehydratase [Cryobacterium levicorallinum]SFH94244.1 2-methylcitrate dehydratase PrpD [Cryobacterium levicorallinum]
MSTTDRTALTGAVNQLAEFAAALTFESLPESVRERVLLLLTDLWGVTVAGARTPELTRLFAEWDAEPGRAPILGTSDTTTAEEAAFLNAVSACVLELDEGNKHSQGHPAAHIVFAAMAAVQRSRQAVTGAEFLVAVVAGYEVAARCGRALDRHPLWHPHGHWGAVGAACAAALVAGQPAERIAAAMDASGGLMTVTPWSMALEGNFTRNLWAANAGTAGLHAARLAGSGLVANTGALASSLGTIIGTLDAAALVDDLGERWFITEGYVKSHSSCAFTHGAIDIIQALKARRAFALADVADVLVTTTALARPLFDGAAHNRLSAMFSFPFVVAAALLNERVDPQAMNPALPAFAQAQALSTRVRMAASDDFDRLLPDARWVRVDITLTDGTVLTDASPNAIGDADNSPLGAQQITAKLEVLIGRGDTAHVTDLVGTLATSADAAATLTALSPTIQGAAL